MARVNHIQTNFTAGELSPRLEGRVDFAKYFNGVARLKNMTVMPHGGAAKRTGFRYVADAVAADKASRLIPFEFSVIQAYVIELGHLTMRFFKDGGIIVDGDPALPVTLATPYTSDEIFAVQLAQTADVLYLVHPNHAPRKLSRTSHVDWTLEEVEFTDGPYLDTNVTATTLDPSGTGGTVTITASATEGINGGQGFLASDVGRLVAFKYGNWGWTRITGFTSSTEVTAEIEGALSDHAATAEWCLGLWSDTTGWPATVTFYEQRLIFAGGRDYPQRIDGSAIGDFEVFTPGTEDDDAFAFTLAADQVNAIAWINAGQSLLIGTVGGEWQMRSSSSDAPITPGNVQVKRQTTYGSAAIAPQRVGNAVLFLQRAGRKIRELTFSFEADGFVAPDLTLLAEHLTAGGITDMTWQQEPDGVLWCVRADGVLLAMTYDRAQDVVAWHQHVVGGVDAAVESVTAIPCPAEGEDQLWIAVRRRVNGTVRRSVEVKERAFGQATAQEDAFFVDSGLTYDGRSWPDATLTFAAITGDAVAVSADAGVFALYVDADDPGDVGNMIRAGGGLARITAVAASDQVTVEIVTSPASAGPFVNGAWSLENLTDELGGLTHLEGETLAILADGAVVTPSLVTGGTVSLAAPAARVQAGLAYDAGITTLPVEAGADQGSAQGRRKRIHRLVLRLWRSQGLKAGTREGRLDTIPFRSSADAMDTPPPLYTGDMRIALPGGWNREGRVVLEHDTPLPLTVLAAMAQLATHEP